MDHISKESLLLGVVGVACIIQIFFRSVLVVYVRKLRPFVSVVFCGLWFLYRLVGGGDNQSLWTILVNCQKQIETFLIEHSGNSIVPRAWSLALDAMVLVWMTATVRTVYCLLHFKFQEYKGWAIQSTYEWARWNIPSVKAEMKKQQARTKQELAPYMGKDPKRKVVDRLPLEGVPLDSLRQQLKCKGELDNQKWKRGHLSGTVYPEGQEHTELMSLAYSSFLWANPLHPGVWPHLNQFEAEVIAMTANMLGNKERKTVVGATTSGGTESIILAIKSHRSFYGQRRYIRHPELICGPTAHASVDKACEMMGIRKVVVPVDPNGFTLIPSEVAKHVTSNTIMIYSSAPNYPQGTIDPISELSDIAVRFNIGLHVDACLGGFVLPFARNMGYNVPAFDFTVPGVTSMSVDTHKYGYATKGSSVVLYRDEDLRQAQYFAYSKWTGGFYSTPTLAGSRPGGLLACAWAAMVSLGEKGYETRVRSILEASRQMAEGIERIPDIHLMCGNQTPTMVVAFSSSTLDIYRVGDKMQEKGWSLSALQRPPCLHLCVTLNTAPRASEFVADLEASVDETRKEGTGKTGGTAAIYGAFGKLPNGPADELLKAFTDVTLST